MNPPRTHGTTRLVPFCVLFIAPAVALAVAASASASIAASAPPTTPPDTAPTDSTSADSAPADTVPTELPEGYVWLVDDTGVITVAVPEAWTDVDTAPAEDINGNPQPWIAVAPLSIDDFLGAFDEPGVLYTAFAFDPDPLFLIDSFSIPQEECATFELQDFASHGFIGVANIGSGCGADGNASWQLVVASPADQSFTAMVQIQTLTDDDIEATQLALDSFTTTGVPIATLNSSVPGSSAPGSSEPLPSDPGTTEAAG